MSDRNGMSEKMLSQLNGQINAELYSAYLYLSMSAWFESVVLPGCAGWMKSQTREEVEHAMRFFDFVYDRGGSVTLEAIEKPESSWDFPLSAFEQAYAHEQLVTARIDALADLAEREKDRATRSMLNWFIDEQVEEESSVDAIVQRLRAIEGGPAGMMQMLDRELGQRGDD